jgi:hypothetical protein
MRLLLSVLAIGVSISVLTGCTSSTHRAASTPTASAGVPLGSDYASGNCPSSSVVSSALSKSVSKQSSKSTGNEFDCDYRADGITVKVTYEYNDNITGVNFQRSLAQIFGKNSLHSVSNIRAVAWEWVVKNGDVFVAGIAHGFTVTVSSNSASAAVSERLERIAVNQWAH